MNKTNKKKQKKIIDCVEQKRLGSKKIFNTVKSMTRSSELKFWATKTLQLKEYKEYLLKKKAV